MTNRYVDVVEMVRKIIPVPQSSPGLHLETRLPINEKNWWEKVGITGLILGVLFWNGMISYIIYASFPHSLAFMLPFVLIGLSMMQLVIRTAIRRRIYQKTTVEISSDPVRPGQKIQLYVSHQETRTLPHLQVKMICRKENDLLYEEMIFERRAFAFEGEWQQLFALTIPSTVETGQKMCWQVAVIGRNEDGTPLFERNFNFRVLSSRVR